MRLATTIAWQSLRLPNLAVGFLAVCLLLCLCTYALAADPALALDAAPASDLTLQAIGGETGSYSSNPLLTTTGAKPLFGSTTSPEMILKDTTSTSTFSLDNQINENVFNQSMYNSTDLHETANLSTKNNLWSAQILQQVNSDTTRTSELSNFNFTPIVAHHLGLTVAPQIAYTPTPVDQLALGGSLTRSEYDNDLFTNYETYSIKPTYTHQVDPLNAALFTIQAQRYQTSPNANLRIDSVGPMVGWQTTLSQRLSVNGSMGAQTTRQYQSGFATTPWTWQYIFDGGLNFKGEQDKIKFDTSRQQDPYGNGTEALQTTFILTETHDLNPLFSLNLDLNYLTATYAQTASGSLNSLASAEVGLTYHATDRLDLTANYQYRYETLTENSSTPTDNAILLNLTYTPQMWTLLR